MELLFYLAFCVLYAYKKEIIKLNPLQIENDWPDSEVDTEKLAPSFILQSPENKSNSNVGEIQIITKMEVPIDLSHVQLINFNDNSVLYVDLNKLSDSSLILLCYATYPVKWNKSEKV